MLMNIGLLEAFSVALIIFDLYIVHFCRLNPCNKARRLILCYYGEIF